jgi:hypothetical protein
VTLDDHAIWSDADSTPLPLGEEMVRTITRDSLRGSDGEAPEEIRALVEGLLRPSPVPWRQLLRQFVATAGRVGRKSTWTREHRRFSHQTNLKKAFAPQRHKEHEGKSVSCLAEVFHQFGLSLYLHKHLNFFVPFVSLWLMIAVFRVTGRLFTT